MFAEFILKKVFAKTSCLVQIYHTKFTFITSLGLGGKKIGKPCFTPESDIRDQEKEAISEQLKRSVAGKVLFHQILAVERTFAPVLPSTFDLLTPDHV